MNIPDIRSLSRIIALWAVIALSCAVAGVCGEKFQWAQLDLGPSCDPYSAAVPEILSYVKTVTNIYVSEGRRTLKPSDDAIFDYPFLVLACRQAPDDFDDDTVRRLRAHLASGGLLWIEDVSGIATSPFDRWVRRNVKAVFPEAELRPVTQEHPVFRSFFLLSSPQGRARVSGFLEGVDFGGRTPVLYSRNDVLGVWPRDAFGMPLLPCVPGGEEQRRKAKMLTLNLIMYALTGSYKLDAIHQPMILMKLREREAR